MRNDSMEDALDRFIRSKGFISSTAAFKNGYDHNYRRETNPRDHLRVRFDICSCDYPDDTYNTVECTCRGSLEEHKDLYFPEHPFDIKGAMGHIAYDIGPYIRNKLKK